jgi:hypothetical protein
MEAGERLEIRTWGWGGFKSRWAHFGASAHSVLNAPPSCSCSRRRARSSGTACGRKPSLAFGDVGATGGIERTSGLLRMPSVLSTRRRQFART